MPIGDAIRAGLMLREYVDNNAQRQEEARLKAQLYGAQVKHYDAQNKLIDLDVQRRQAFLQGLPNALTGGQAPQAPPAPSSPLAGAFGGTPTEAQPATSALSPQPGSAGPQAPGQLSVAQLHDTQNFQDSTEKLLERLSLLAVQTDNMQDFGTLQQGMIERQKIRTVARQQDLQDTLRRSQEAIANLPDTPESAPKRAMLRHLQTALLFQLGKTNDALALQEGKVVPFQAGGGVMQVLPGEEPKIIKAPLTIAEKAQQEQEGRNIGKDTPLPPRGQAQTTPPAPVPPASPRQERGPEPGQQRFQILQGGKPVGTVDATDQAAAAAMVRREFPGQVLTLKPGAPQARALGAEAQLAVDKEQALRNQAIYGQATPPEGKPHATEAMVIATNEAARTQAAQDTKTGKPGSTQADVTAADKQVTQNVEAGKPGATAAQLKGAAKQVEMNRAVYAQDTPPEGKPPATEAMVVAVNEAARVQAAQDTKTGTPGSTQADVTAADKQVTQNVEAGKPGATAAQLKGAAKQVEMNRAVYGQDTPPAGKPPATEALVAAANAAARVQAEQDTKTGKPGSTQADVTAADRQVTQDIEAGKKGATRADITAAERQAAQDVEAGKKGATRADIERASEQEKLDVQAGKKGATLEDVSRARLQGEGVPQVVEEKLTTLRHAARLVDALKAVPEARQQEYVGLLRRPKAQLEDFFADLNKAGAGNAERLGFVADAKDLFYAINRIKVGANFTKVEQDLLDGVFPDTGVASYTQFKTALTRVGPLLQKSYADVVGLTGATRGTLNPDIKGPVTAPAGKPATSATTPKTAPASQEGVQETPEAQAERLRQKYGIPTRTR